MKYFITVKLLPKRTKKYKGHQDFRRLREAETNVPKLVLFTVGTQSSVDHTRGKNENFEKRGLLFVTKEFIEEN